MPPPVAIDYQLPSFRGQKPKYSPREMAFDFPRYYDDEIAPELVVWWDRMLSAGKIPRLQVRETRRALAETRKLMRPLLLYRLWAAAQ